MEKVVSVKGLALGSGLPKICVPVVGGNLAEIAEQVQAAAADGNADLLEWRADCFRESANPMKLLEALGKIRKIWNNKPLLFTFRTEKEGGARAVSDVEYLGINRIALTSGMIDLVDIQYETAKVWLAEFIMEAHRNRVYTVVSNHDFQATPSREAMTALLSKMSAAGADLAKLAVMPQKPSDVLELMAAAAQVHEQTGTPLIAISMSEMGSISRICGKLSGSAVTFGTVGEASAPGQMAAAELKRRMLELDWEHSEKQAEE